MHTMETILKRGGWEKGWSGIAPLATHPENGVGTMEGREINASHGAAEDQRDIPTYVGGKSGSSSDKRAHQSSKTSSSSSRKSSGTWYPRPTEKNMFYAKQLLDNPVGSDITFCVGEEQEKFSAHKCILFPRAPRLYELVSANDDATAGGDDYFEIPDISKHTFSVLLEHIYAGSLPEISDNDDTFAKDLLLVADRFGCTLLKLWVESEITTKLIFQDNAAEWLSCADALSCPLLKEACMNLYAEHPAKVRKSAGWQGVQETPKLLDELLAFLAEKMGASNNSPFCEQWSIAKLRENLDSMGLELSGNRDALIKRLKDQGVGSPGVPPDSHSEAAESIPLDNSVAESDPGNKNKGRSHSKSRKQRKQYREYV